MNEITKLYENVGIEKIYDCSTCPYVDCEDKCKVDMGTNYPYFTAEKQLELIKFIAKRDSFGLNWYTTCDSWSAKTDFRFEYYDKAFEHENFDEALAGLVNQLWQDLTEEEKQQIKEILE